MARLTCKRKAPDPALFVGSGKADEIRMLAQMHGAKEVWFDQALSPAQQRNLERHIQMPVNDRTMLILEIFAQRARSHEGKLQVEPGSSAVHQHAPGAPLEPPGASGRRYRWPWRPR